MVKKAPSQKATKDEIYWRIFDAVVRLEVQKGHLKWKVADLSRSAKVSRTLIYYYFGDSKEEIIRNATVAVAEVFFGNDESKIQLLVDGEIAAVVKDAREMASRSTYVVDFYLHWRRREGDIADILSKVENRYFEKLAKIFPQLELDSLKAIYATFFGLVVNPAVTPAAIDRACEHIKQQFHGKS